jgi:hypothetical protein
VSFAPLYQNAPHRFFIFSQVTPPNVIKKMLSYCNLDWILHSISPYNIGTENAYYFGNKVNRGILFMVIERRISHRSYQKDIKLEGV